MRGIHEVFPLTPLNNYTSVTKSSIVLESFVVDSTGHVVHKICMSYCSIWLSVGICFPEVAKI